MRVVSTSAALIVLLSIASAQSASLITELPSCAVSRPADQMTVVANQGFQLNCIFQYLPDTTCAATDFSCMCATPQLWTNATNCVVPSCTRKEALTAQNISAQICNTPVRNKTLEVKVLGPTLCLIAIIFVAIRIIARRPFVSDLFGWDDALIIAALAFAMPVGVTHIYLARYGLGKDIWTVPFGHITDMLRLFYVSEIFYLFATVLTKISILVFYLRVFTSHRFQMVAKAVIVITAAFCFSILFPLLFQCTPVSHAWTRWTGDGKGRCINVNAGTWSHAAINMVLDLVVLVLPLPSLFRLQLTYTWSRKLRILVMFNFGLVVTVVSVLRLQTLIHFANTRNPTWDYFGIAVWSVTETMVGIICACLPMAKVFFTQLVPQWLGMTVASTRNAPTPGVSTPGGQWTATTASGTSSTNRFSKPPRRASVIIGTMQEEADRERGDFVQLVEVDSKRSIEGRIGLAK